MMLDNALFSNRLTAEIERRGMMKKDFGAAIGASDVTVSYWCNGKRIPNLQQIIGIAEFLGVSIDYLVGLSDNPNRFPSLADDLGLSDKAIVNMRGIAGESDKRDMLNRLLEFSGLDSVLSDIALTRRLRREIPGNNQIDGLSDRVLSDINKSGHVLLDSTASADYLESRALNRLQWAFKDWRV